MTDHAGIAPVPDMKARMNAVQHGVLIRLGEGQQVIIRRLGIPLLRTVDTVAPVSLAADAGVEEMRSPLLILATAAGEAVQLTLCRVGREGDGQRLPGKQIA